MEMRKLVLIAFLCFLVPLARADTYISDCSVLNITGETYYLTADIINSTATNCMDITANNIVLDCQGHTIDGVDASGTYGISSIDHNNITIKNCVVIDWWRGIRLTNANDNTITNSTANGNTIGIFLHYSSNNQITNSILQENTDYDFYVHAELDEQCNNYVENVTGSGNKPIKYFNYPVNLANEVFSRLILCNADNSNITNITIDASPTLTNNDLLLVRTDNSRLTNINSSFNRIGILFAFSSNNTIINSTANSNRYGIVLEYSSNNSIINSIDSDNVYFGIDLFFSSNNTITNSTANNNSRGIYLHYSSNNQITNSIVSGNGNGIWLHESSYNLIYNNLFNNTNNFISYTFNPNYWNTTRQPCERIYSPGTEIGGNYWTNPNGTGYSDTCSDADKDGFCDEPYTLAEANVDYLPLSDEYPLPPLITGIPLISRVVVGLIAGIGAIVFMLRSFDIVEPKKLVEYLIALAVIVLTVASLIVLFG